MNETKTYVVHVTPAWEWPITVEAVTPEEALELAKEEFFEHGTLTLGYVEYSSPETPR